MPDPARLCEAVDCDRPAHSGGRYCAGHAKRLERGAPLSAPMREQQLSLRERVQKLAINLADADSDDDAAYERAWDALEHAVKDWEKNMRQRRAGKARWRGVTAAQRKEAMQAAALARWNASQASIAGPATKGKRRARRGG